MIILESNNASSEYKSKVISLLREKIKRKQVERIDLLKIIYLKIQIFHFFLI